MEFKPTNLSVTNFRGDAVIVNLFQGVKEPGGATGAVDKALAGEITRAVQRGELSGKLGEALTIHTLGRLPCAAVIVVGLGKAEAFGTEEIRQAAACAVNQAGRLKARVIGTIVHGAGIGGVDPETAAQALAEGAVLAAYQFTGYKKGHSDCPDTVTVIERDPVKLKKIARGIELGRIVAEAQNTARDLTNEPANHLTPELFDRRIRNLIARYGLGRRITHAAYGPKEIKAHKMGALWSVAQGSENEPRFIVLGLGRKRPRLCLIGKAVTFDSGGISLKPAEGMGRMKGDMSGGGIVVATLIALARAGINLDLMVLVPAVENLPSGRASRPGDIVTAMNGSTIEIVSTDAEGRMTLADAICYAEQKGAPVIVDIATLTGGAMIAFGDVASAVMGNDQPTVNDVLAAAAAAGERMWQLPLFPEYDEKVKSDIADLKNSAGREGSPITAGSFLKAFTKDSRWVHIDIAGREIADRIRSDQPKGATGHGVRTLFEYCRQMAGRSV